MSKFVEFLKTMNTIAAQYVHEMEEIIFQDPSSAIVKGRKFLEVLLNDIIKYEEVDESYLTLTLYEKISYLIKDQIIDSKNIQKSFETVRIIGNKAAHHSETNEFADAFAVHRELYNIAIWYHDLYFYSTNNIKIPLYEPPKPQLQNSYQEIKKLMNDFKKILGNRVTTISETDLTSKRQRDNINKNNFAENWFSNKGKDNLEKQQNREQTYRMKTRISEKKLPKGESYLIRELYRLRTSAKEAVEHANHFSTFKDYLHVDRPILKDLESILEENSKKRQGNLILLCGNVGDGKSHLLAYLKKTRPDLIDNYDIYNDATESFSPNKDSLATLEESLSDFSDQKIGSNTRKFILAINMGVLHNFMTRQHKKYTYQTLIDFINKSKLFTQQSKPIYAKGQFCLLSFGDYNSYELTETGVFSTFYSKLLKKIVNPTENNPFYLALLEDEKNQISTVIHENYKLLQNDTVQEIIIQLVIQSIITDKLVISARAFLNLIADILIPNNYQANEYLSDLDKLEYTLPNLLFSYVDRSEILKSISNMDPLHRRSKKTDQLVIELNTLSNWDKVVKANVKNKIAIRWLSPFFNQESLIGYSFDSFIETFVRIIFLLNKEYAESLMDESYKKYIEYLYHFNKGNKVQIINFYKEFKKIIFLWKGSPKKDYIFTNKPTEKYRIAQKLLLTPKLDHLMPKSNELLNSHNNTIVLVYKDPHTQDKAVLDIDYPLFELLYKIKRGYRPNKKDDENAIRLTEFVDKVLKFGGKKNDLLVYFKQDHRLYSFRRSDFDEFCTYVFERESN